MEHAKKLLAALQQHLAGTTGAAPQQTTTSTQQVGFSVDGERS